MDPISRWRRAIRIVAVSILVLAVVAAISVSIQQHILRWRAQRLLADIRDLQLGKSTWTDAQKIMARWGAWGSYEGTCTPARCGYRINLPDAFERFQSYWPSGCCVWILRPYRFLGGRDGFVVASVEVLNGLIWAKGYGLYLGVPTHDEQDEYGYELIATANTVWRTDIHNYGRAVHPEFRIGHPGGCEGCKEVYARFTPFAAPATINGLLEFNFDCLTRRSPCRDQMDVMPSVWTKVLAEEKEIEEERKRGANPFAVCNATPEFLGRDQVNVVVAQVMSKSTHETDDTSLDVGFRLIDRLKRATFWKPEMIRVANLPKSVSVGSDRDVAQFKPGEEYILAFPNPYPFESGNWIDLYPCGPIPATGQNLAAARHGISRDIFPETRTFWP